MSTVQFPILFHEKKNRKWKIWVVDNAIYRTDGLATKEFTKTASCKECEGKAHTTSVEQAVKEAKAMWVKKISDDFKPAKTDIEGLQLYNQVMKNRAQQGGTNVGVFGSGVDATTEIEFIDDDCVEVVDATSATSTDASVDAMLAHKFEEKKKKMVWSVVEKAAVLKTLKGSVEKFHTQYFDASEGCTISPKLDGIRCLAHLSDKGAVLAQTRESKQFVHLTKQKEHIALFLKNYPNVVLDGEWYVNKPVVDGIEVLNESARFNFISSCCRPIMTNANKNEDQIEYHVFDMVFTNNKDAPQSLRLATLQKMFTNYETTCKKLNMREYLKAVELQPITSEAEIYEWHDKFFNQSYEGVMLRDSSAIYEGKRSIHLLKYKQFEDAEFKIVGVTEGTGGHKGVVILICENSVGTKFNCEVNMPNSITKKMYQEKSKYIGKNATIKYQQLTVTNVPRFGRCTSIRDYE